MLVYDLTLDVCIKVLVIVRAGREKAARGAAAAGIWWCSTGLNEDGLERRRQQSVASGHCGPDARATELGKGRFVG